MLRLCLALAIILLGSPAWAETCRVLRVIDGDTLVFISNSESTKRIRLYGIDCPEKTQPRAVEATQATSQAIAEQAVQINE